MSDLTIERRIASLFSISRKAGKLVHGESLCEKALSGGDARLVVTAADASDNTRKKFRQKTFYYGTPFAEVYTKEGLGHSIGVRAAATVAITDEGLALRIIELLKEEGHDVNIWQK